VFRQITIYVDPRQGDQIAHIFAYWAIVYVFGRFFAHWAIVYVLWAVF
jgi:hypothetical protein